MNKIDKNKFLNEITISLLKSNKNRNIIAAIAIILTSLLFTSIFTIGFGLKSSMERERMRMVGGDFHIGFKDLNETKLEDLIKHDLIEEYGIREMVGFGINEEFYGENVEVSYGDDNYLKHSFIQVEKGRMPETENEILIDERILTMLGRDKSLDQVIDIKYEVLNELGEKIAEEEKEFKVVGSYLGDELLNAKFIFVSKDFVENFNLVENNYSLNILTKNSWNLEEKAEKIINESNYNTLGNDNNSIDYGINWAYNTEDIKNLNSMEIFSIVFLLVIVILTGYLIIYNIFNISVYLDMRMYGLMKAIGMGRRDLRKISIRQAFMISAMSIPIGLLLGYGLGLFLLPKIINNFSLAKNFVVSHSPMIFITTIIFTLFTVYISVLRPSKKIESLSPVLAVKYNETIKKKSWANNLDLNIKNLSIMNTFRNKSKLALVVLSLSLSMLVLNSTIILLGEPDLDKYLVDFIDSDYVIADKSYFNYMYGDSVSSEIIEGITRQDGFKNGGAIYLNYANIKEVNQGRNISLYGMDKEIIDKQKLLVKGSDKKIENLRDDQVLVGVNKNKIEDVLNGSYHYKLGDELRLNIEGQEEHTYEIAGFIEYGLTNTARSYSVSVSFDEDGNEVRTMDDIVYLNKDSYENIFPEAKIMVYQFNADNRDKMDIYLDNLVRDNPSYKYDSRDIQKNSIRNIQNLFLLVGTVMTAIMALIGILNFLNVTVTNILARRDELKLMKIIGMNDKEIKKMLIYESMNYFLLTAALGSFITILFSHFILKLIMEDLNFTSYSFSLNGVLFILPVFFLIAIFLPIVIYSKKIGNKENIG